MSIVYYWKRLYYDGFHWDYLINEMGDVVNLDWKPIKWRYISNGKGYHVIDLYHNGKKKTLLVHRLVASTFLPNPENRRTVNHLDGNKDNNSIHNLEWATYSENNKHAYDRKLKIAKCGEESIFSKYNEDHVRSICSLLEKGISPMEISKKLDLPISLVASVRSGFSWKHISREYRIAKPRYYMDIETKTFIRYKASKGCTIKQILKHLKWPNDSKHIKRVKRALQE